MHRVHRQPPMATFGTQVHPRGNAFAVQERQHVIAVHPLVRRGVDLQPVAEVEQRSVRLRSQTSESNGDSKALASMRGGCAACRQ
jgi:hypothetical protein